MHHVVSCKKYHPITPGSIRIVSADDVDDMLLVALSSSGSVFTVHSSHKLTTTAMDAAWELVDREPDLYQTDMLPQRPSTTLAEIAAAHSA
jgi:hypothetical protein